MACKKQWIAMLLAGGQGSRLGVLTKNTAKPAVGFGGKYRVIDFTLSNCVNSGIDTVGVLTQYQPLELNEYIGNGSAWDLDRRNGGVHILPPYQQIDGGNWYKGTANAVYQNLKFIEKYEPEYVIVLSGDHIYSMNYETMLSEHKKKNADCSIAVIDVEKSEAGRFGIMNADRDGKIFEFEEKPRNPKSTLASMGVYIFGFDKLKKYLRSDEKSEKTSGDFGKDIIPAMLAAGEKLFAYRYNGYWKDVGTVKSLWEANMDLLAGEKELGLSQDFWRIYSQNPVLPPQFISAEADIKNSIATEGCRVFGKVSSSVLFAGACVEKGAEVVGSVLMPGCRVMENSKVFYSIVGNNCTVSEGASVGEMCEKDKKITVLADNIKIAPGISVGAGETVMHSRKEEKKNAGK